MVNDPNRLEALEWCVGRTLPIAPNGNSITR